MLKPIYPALHVQRLRSRSILAALSCLLAVSVSAGDAAADRADAARQAIEAQAGTVQVPSLQVRERLRSIEQINVTAEKPVQAERPVSEAVARLLDEAKQLDAQAQAESESH